jgi:hypothetical protein
MTSLIFTDLISSMLNYICVKIIDFISQLTAKGYSKYYLIIKISLKIMKSSSELIIVMIFVFPMLALSPVFGQESTTTTNTITDLIKTTAEKIKSIATEVANNSTGLITPNEAENILNQLGEASKQTALSGADVLSNFSGEIKESLK